MARIIKLLSPGLLLALLLVSFFMNPVKASALNYTDHPMDDSIFRASFTMSAADIQSFLQNKGSGLAGFSDIEDCGSSSGGHYAFYATYYSCGSRVAASKIIYDAAQAYGINPQAILATLQKEQSLVTTPNPVSSQLNYAMGYGCPDSGGCSYAGFFNQVDNGTWQFRTDYELSAGNNYWGYGPSSFPCSGATRYYNKGLLPGNDVTFIDDHGTGYTHFVIPNPSTATLYCYTPHVFPGSAQQYYSGSYWFVYYFSQWFGTSTAPYAFKASDTGTIYLYINGYKVAVTAMGILQDYGVSPAAIQTLAQSRADAIPTPSFSANGISPTLSYIVKSADDNDADGGSLYLISIGHKYQFKSMQQFNDFGFSESNIGYLPLSTIQAVSGNNQLSNYISTPVSAAFQVSGGHKRIIFDYQTYIGLNPSNQATPISYFDSNLIPSGNPIANNPVLVKYSDSDTAYLLINGTYYTVSTFDAYNCWGFDTTLHTPVYQVADNSYLSPINPGANLGCFLNNGSTNYLLSNTTKYSVSSSYGLTTPAAASQDLINLSNSLPTNSSPLKQYLRSNQSGGVWYLNSGNRASLTYANYVLLHLDLSQVSQVDNGVLPSIPVGGLKLGTGKTVKSDTDARVYAIFGDSRLLYARSDDFVGYGNGWSDIESYPQSTLDQYYPYRGKAVSSYIYDQGSNTIDLVDPSGCYLMDSDLLSNYNQNRSTIIANQTYDSSLFPGLHTENCKAGSVYVKQPDQALVYVLKDGTKHPFSGWNALVNYSQTSNPYIVTLSTNKIAAFPTGSTL